MKRGQIGLMVMMAAWAIAGISVRGQTAAPAAPTDPAILDNFRKALKVHDSNAVAQLLAAPNIWADDFPALLAQWVVDNPPPAPSANRFVDAGVARAAVRQSVLQLLDQHYAAWAKDAAFGPRLRQAIFGDDPHWEKAVLREDKEPMQITVLPNGDTVEKMPPGTKPDDDSSYYVEQANEIWFKEAQALAWTHDPAAVAWLRPYLDNKMVILDRGGMLVQQERIPLRACDAAHDAILHMLNEPGEFGVLASFYRTETVPDKNLFSNRDRDIDRLVKLLATRDKATPATTPRGSSTP